MPFATILNRANYALASVLYSGSMTLTSYFVITKAIRHYIPIDFRVGRFFVLLGCVHITTSLLVVYHFVLFTKLFTLDELPGTYTFYLGHISAMPLWKAPFDWVIVWIFSFSLYYNYLLYTIGFKVFKDLFTMKINKTELERENLKLEHNFLKAQLNPHFLFNTLNNIYSFSVLSPEKVGDMILKLSDLMRYSLYETNEEYVPLDKELKFLESYISLQRTRHDKTAKIIYKIQGETVNKKVTPLLLVIFLENAFKHGLQSIMSPNWIEVTLEIQENILIFSINNSTSNFSTTASGGLGLKNVQKRLDYYYPNQHKLTIKSESATFFVNLIISLNGDAIQSFGY